MDPGSFFILLILLVLAIAIGIALWAFSANRSGKGAVGLDDDGGSGQRPEHTRVDDEGHQTFVGT